MAAEEAGVSEAEGLRVLGWFLMILVGLAIALGLDFWIRR